jgi:ornithine carbamoyltransferase
LIIQSSPRPRAALVLLTLNAMKNFLTTSDFTRDELNAFIELALRFKRGEDLSKPLDGKSVGLVFFNPSSRTRALMQISVYEFRGRF